MNTIRYEDVVGDESHERQLVNISWLAQKARLQVLEMLHAKGTGHWGGAASSAEVMNYLYFKQMNIDPSQPKAPWRDRFVLSKGHASAMLYATMANRGYFSEELLMTFRDINSGLQGHPCMKTTAGVDMSTGALGHGISVGLGMALASQASKLDFWTYVMVGEGCLDEGESWEGIMAAGKFTPERFVVLVDYNKVQLDGNVQDIMPLEPLADKFKAFNWKVAPKAYDGHDMTQIAESFAWLEEISSADGASGPYVIIYNTVKGKGVDHMENSHAWHGAPVGDDDYSKAKPQLEQRLTELEAQL